MRIMLDANIIISAALFPKGRVAAAYMKALQYPYESTIGDPRIISVAEFLKME